jgi:hypothetical protein
MPRIYVSSRRTDSASMPGRIIAALSEAFDPDNVTASGDAPPGMASKVRIEREVGLYEVVLVIMGDQWATARNQYGFSALFEPNDSIRMEIETGLRLGKVIMPVLVNTAEMPSAANVPATLAPLVEKTAVRVRDGADFEWDMQTLIAQLDPKAAKPVVKAPPSDHHIFLSYSRKDASVMERLREDLRGASFDVWADDNLDPGTSAWEKSISAAIRSAGCLVVILSPDAEQSTWVGRELAMAETLDKRIFPILARGSERDAIPFRLMSHQFVDARHNYGEALEKLLGAVRKHLNLS